MNTENINWDEVPDTLSLEQIRKLIHVSKRVAKTLLDTEIPCIQKARTTHKYYVDKQDLIDYLGTHSGTHYQISNTKKRSCNSRLFTSDIPEYFKGRMAFYFRSEFADYPELIRIRDVAQMTGYCKEQIGEWANEGLIGFVVISNVRYINKSNLIDFLCTEDFDSVYRKSKWHKQHIEIFREWKKKS
ncbi:MAG: helix-turn-helix domain-containing protein [Clostridiales bacterium]|nr:helix-turn-helix domain-containing protein [Clostridiales bacterium]